MDNSLDKRSDFEIIECSIDSEGYRICTHIKVKDGKLVECKTHRGVKMYDKFPP